MPTEFLRPNAVGDKSFLDVNGDTDGWKCVDEVSSDSDATYVSAPGAAASDLYNIPDSAIPAGAVISQIGVGVNCKKVGARTCYAQVGIKTGGTEYWTSNKTLTTSYAVYSNIWLLNPQTGLAWTKADIDALQLGIYLTFNIGTYGCCTQVWVVVTYTVAAAAKGGYSGNLAVIVVPALVHWIRRRRKRRFIITLK
jgi:hypothetical protein